RRDRDPGGAGRVDRGATRAREDRDYPLLLRGADAAGDRRRPRCDGVPRLAAPHQGDSAPALAALGCAGPTARSRGVWAAAAARSGRVPPGRVRGLTPVTAGRDGETGSTRRRLSLPHKPSFSGGDSALWLY